MSELLEFPVSRTNRRSQRGVGLMSPYARLGLRRNPFGELTRDERASLAIVDITPWLPALNVERTALQFIGDKGHGKTTHLLAIHGSLPSSPYVYLPEDGPLPAIPRLRPLLIDEAQRLGRFARWRVFARGGPLVLGTHRDFSSELQRAGLQVVTIDVSAKQSPERLVQILNARIDRFRLADADSPLISISQARKLQQQFGGDIRAVESYLYDLFQAAAQRNQHGRL
jgi:hypothetical protein